MTTEKFKQVEKENKEIELRLKLLNLTFHIDCGIYYIFSEQQIPAGCDTPIISEGETLKQAYKNMLNKLKLRTNKK